jgi:outer membrane cobalamin receptor
LDLRANRRLNVGITAFIRRSEDLIDWARPSDESTEVPWETRNVEEATFRGLEGDLSLIGPGDVKVTLGGMLLSVESEEAAGFTSKYALRPLEQQLKVGIGKALTPGLTLDVNLQRARRGGEDPYYLLDFRGAVALGFAWVYLDANNLLDSEYPDITGALAPGRALFLGLRFGSR